MNLDVVAGSGNDEFYTPHYAILPLIKYLPPNSSIWCPFDSDKSLIVKNLADSGHFVINTHLDEGEDFFQFSEPLDCDLIISNPPYSKKTEVLEKLFGWGKPFGMLLGLVGLFESKKRFEMFRNNEFEVMYFDKRISYYRSYEDEKPALNPPFSSVWLCHKVLPKPVLFEVVDKKRGSNK